MHLIFDRPYKEKFNPKHFTAQSEISIHNHISFEPNSSLSFSWHNVIQCSICNHSLVQAIGLSLLHLGRFWVCGNQKLIVAGCYEDIQNQGTILIVMKQV